MMTRRRRPALGTAIGMDLCSAKGRAYLFWRSASTLCAEAPTCSRNLLLTPRIQTLFTPTLRRRMVEEFAVMELALEDAGLAPPAIQYLNAHATSTQLGDRAEAKAICDAFGDHAENLLVSSTKSMTGHLLGAAGSLEAGLTVLALRDQVAPPTTNVREADDACRFRLIREEALGAALEYAMTNSFGFGGTNASLIFRAPTDLSVPIIPAG